MSVAISGYGQWCFSRKDSPTPIPNRKRAVPSKATSVPTWKSLATYSVAAEKILEPKVVLMVVRPYSAVVTTFFLAVQFSGRYGSSGPSKSTSTSGAVFWWVKGCENSARGLRDRIVERTFDAEVCTCSSRRELTRLRSGVLPGSPSTVVVILISSCSADSFPRLSATHYVIPRMRLTVSCRVSLHDADVDRALPSVLLSPNPFRTLRKSVRLTSPLRVDMCCEQQQQQQVFV